MNWLNLHVGFLTDPAFVGAEPTQRATWLCLVSHCVRQENGGVISDCADWGSRRWMQTCGITKEEVLQTCDLWSFDGVFLRVWGYPIEREREVKAKRKGGRLGGKRSAETRKNEEQIEAQLEGEDGAQLEGEDGAQLEGEPQRKGKGKGKGKEGEREGVCGTREDVKSIIPTVEEVKNHALVIGMTETDAKEFHEFWSAAEWKDKNGLDVRNWKAKLASRKNQIAERKAENANRERNGNQNRASSAQHGRVTATGKGKW